MTIVYTTIFGGSDSLKPAPKGADRCVCFVDELHAGDLIQPRDWRGWEPMFVPNIPTDVRRHAWHMRCIAHKLFPEADRTVWIDASFTLTNLGLLLEHAGNAPIAALRHHKRRTCYEEGREIVKVGQAAALPVNLQLDVMRAEGFKPSHLSISCILVRDRSVQVECFNNIWDRNIRLFSGDNTQLSLDYSAWVNGLTIKGLRGTRHENPYAVHDHADHKKRRRPYDTEAA